jgi:glycosyltransferase involved in cell wall biosynthesis
MRILYAASDQTVPGTTGGSVHVAAVAGGLAAVGHEVHALVTPNGEFPAGPVHWVAFPPPLGRKQLRWANLGAVRALARRIGAEAVIERYYNFGGEGISAAAACGAVAVLEVNAPVIDHRRSVKRLVDRALLVEPMRRWRERICRLADVIVTPSANVLPADTPGDKILELEWGADTERFHPNAPGPVPFDRPADVVLVFAGAFRAWHGAIHIVTALRELHARGRTDIGAVFIGDGPELPRVREAAAGLRGVIFAGAVPHAQMPACLAACDVGVAPFDLDAHPPLSLGFYWSPLKLFEYMATGLPVVAPAVDRIPSLVGHNREGLLYDSAIPSALPHAIEALTDPSLRERLGRLARERAHREYSWSAHCRALDAAMRNVARRTANGRASDPPGRVR